MFDRDTNTEHDTEVASGTASFNDDDEELARVEAELRALEVWRKRRLLERR